MPVECATRLRRVPFALPAREHGRLMPASKAVPTFDRTWLALVLTCRVFAGAFLGIAAQFVLVIGVIFYVLPWMGLLPQRCRRGDPCGRRMRANFP